ncbi:thiamine biosynthesis protein [Candidatus Wolfebacteria bacterium]|nr:MAG: thiamine biosynthesis protein [Candidatus Wolfebacteria bacterium]
MNKKILIRDLLILFSIVSSIFVITFLRPAPEQASKKIENITVKLKWVHQAQFAGNYIAQKKGFYKDESLQVNLVPFSFEDPTIEAVAEGRALIGISGADELLLARSKGVPLRAFAVIFKTNPVAAYALKESGITKPQDFIGKTVGLQRGTNVDLLYFAMMEKLGIDREKINEVTIGYDATELLNGTTDVSTGYIINEPYEVIAAGREVNKILMADYGVNMYADVLFATEETIEKRPELVEGFLRATLKGWQYAIENEEEAIDITLTYAADRTQSHETYLFTTSIPLIHTGDSPLGWMEEEEWDRIHDILLEQNILNKKMNSKDAYTMKFLKEIYIN